MNPRKRAEIVAEVATRLGVNPTLLDDITQFYYKDVQRKLSSLQHLQVDVPELGTFQIKGKPLATKALKTSALIKKIAGADSLQSQEIRREKHAELQAMEQLLLRFERQRERRLTIRQQRYEKPAHPMVSEGPDSGGN